VAKVNVVTEKEDEKQLADILFLLVAIQSLVALELGSYIGQFLVNTLYLGFFTFTYVNQTK
jgi:hypothetical protein